MRKGVIRSLHARLAASAAVALLALLSACSSARPPAKAAAPARRDVCLYVNANRGAGSGFAAEWNGKRGVMTAWHVVEAHVSDADVTGNGVRLTGLVFDRVGVTDIAWCEREDLPAAWVVLRVSDPIINELVDAWGWANGGLQHRQGIVIREEVERDPHMAPEGRYVRLGCPVIEGMSGGPVLNPGGRVVGVICLLDREKEWRFTEGRWVLVGQRVELIAGDIP